MCADILVQDCLASLLEIQNPGIFAELHDFESALSTKQDAANSLLQRCC